MRSLGSIFLALMVAAAAARPARAQTPASAPAQQFSAEQAVNPQPILFMVMRNLTALPPGPETAGLHKQIETWQAFTHDRKRKVGADWYSPKDFVRRRESFLDLLKQARDLVRQADKFTGPTLDERSQRNSLLGKAATKMRQAADYWADPLLRTFLAGVAELQSSRFLQAESMFAHCRRQAPRVAAFHQGYALAQAELNRELEGLEAMTAAMRLCPESQDALILLEQAMSRVPGFQIQTPAYRAARQLHEQYHPPSGTSKAKGPTWLLPGKPLTVTDGTLPELPYDRLVFLQAVGVPVGKNVLMVDRALPADAIELLVKIDEETFAVARAIRSSSSAASREPLALVSVAGVEFTPLAFDEKAAVSPGEPVTVYGLGLYEEMGRHVRQAAGKVLSADEGGKARLSVRLAAGEAAGPVIGGDGRLLGFLAGKTDPMAYDGGPDAMIGQSAIAPLVKRGAKGYASSSSTYGSSASAKRKSGPRKVDGQCFVLYAAVGEKF